MGCNGNYKLSKEMISKIERYLQLKQTNKKEQWNNVIVYQKEEEIANLKNYLKKQNIVLLVMTQ